MVFFWTRYYIDSVTLKHTADIIYWTTNDKCIWYMVTDEFDFDQLDYPNDTIVIWKITENNDCNYYSEKNDLIFSISWSIINEAIQGWSEVQLKDLEEWKEINAPSIIKDKLIKNKATIIRNTINNYETGSIITE